MNEYKDTLMTAFEKKVKSLDNLKDIYHQKVVDIWEHYVIKEMQLLDEVIICKKDDTKENYYKIEYKSCWAKLTKKEYDELKKMVLNKKDELNRRDAEKDHCDLIKFLNDNK